MPTPLSWTREAAKILDRENRRMTEPEPRQPATAAGLKWAEAMDCYHCTQKILAIEAEAADASGLRAALNDLASAHHGLSDEPPHQFHASYRDCPDHHCQKALAAVERSATSAKPAGEPDWYEEAVSSGMLPNPPVAGPDAGERRLTHGEKVQRYFDSLDPEAGR